VKKVLSLAAATALTGMLIVGGRPAHALVVTPNPGDSALTSVLITNPAGFASYGASYALGNSAQVGTYTGFASPPRTIGNGVVLSTGNATDVVGPYRNDVSNGEVSTGFGGGSTPEIDSYAPGHVTNWSSSHDAAVLTVNFTLSSPSAIAFNFLFGSVEFPVYTSNYTDAFFAFLDGNQITFDTSGNAVQVGSSFASLLNTDDTNTIFTGVGANAGNDAHGLLGVLTTTSGTLTAGAHTLQFEVADTNDAQLDSAIFLTDLHTTTGGSGPVTGGGGTILPEPASMALMGAGLVALGVTRRRRAK
jgi:hypothetical protein